MASQQQPGSNRRPTQSPLEQYNQRNMPALPDAAVDPEVISSDLETFERVQLDVAIATAKRWPRLRPSEIIAEMIEYATIDEDTAVSCFYTFEHEDEETGDKTVQYGPSIRLAEIAVVCYRNLRAGARVVSNNGRMIQALGFCFDLERNVAAALGADRQIATRKFEGGREVYRTWSLDMQMKTGNAAVAFAYRNNVFKIVPGVLIKPVLEACKKKAAGQGAIEERFTKAIKGFRPWGITEQQLKTIIGKPGVPTAELVDDDIIALKGYWSRLSDGETTAQELFGGIDKDGTDRRGEQKQQQEQQQTETKPASGETNTAANDTVGAPDDTKGPLKREQYNKVEWASILKVAVDRGLVQNEGQLTGWLSRWQGTKGEAALHIATWAPTEQKRQEQQQKRDQQQGDGLFGRGGKGGNGGGK